MKRCPSDGHEDARSPRPFRLGKGLRGPVRTAVIFAVILGLVDAPLRYVQAAPADTRVNIAELTPDVESAIDRGLKFLSTQQNKDGSWGREYKVAGTSLTLMAFMLKGNFPRKGQYGVMLDKGVEYLIKKSNDGAGYMGINMYEHGLATLALSEAWGMSDRDEIRDVLKRAVEVIIKSQNNAGGWRYDPRPVDADISVTVMQVVALSSAREAGILVPSKVIEKAVKYVKSCQVKSNGGFGYTGPQDPIFSRSAAGTMSLLMSGERDTPAVRKALEYLRKLPDSKFTNLTGFYLYGHYYAIQSMYQAGEDYYQDWYPHIRDVLLTKQAKDGSWRVPDASDSAYGASMSILILGVPYRYLPIYQR
ncbi:MAG: prenyltransferase/squalene oxidase repeat-containing protein [Phycisphaerae bacterium]